MPNSSSDSESDDKDKEIKELKDKLKSSNKTIKEWKVKYSEWEDSKESMDDVKTKLERQIKKLEKSIKEKDEELKESEDKSTEILKKLKELPEQKDKFEEEINNLKEYNLKNERDNSEKIKKLEDKYKQELKEWEDKYEDTIKKLKEMQEQKDQFEEEIKELKEDNSKNERNNNKKIKTLEEELSNERHNIENEIKQLEEKMGIKDFHIEEMMNLKDRLKQIVLSLDNWKNLMKKTEFIESCVIDPGYVTAVDIVNLEEWITDMEVEFVLNESCKWYSGSLKWTGLINKMMSAVVYVNVAEPNDYIRNYLCNKELCDRLQTSYNDNMVIVLLSALTKGHLVKEGLYIRRIFEYVNDKKIGVDILVDLINNEDASALKYVVKQWKHPINLEHYPELLPKLISQDSYDVIAVLLETFDPSNSDNIHLLNIAKYFLMRGNNDIFILACKICQDANVTMENGETFLTSIMKDSDDEDIIKRVIETNIFDINKTNNDGDSPLVLACRRLMVSTVRLLVNSGASVSYNNNMAFGTVMDQQKNTSDTAKLKQAIEIFGIIGRGLQSNNPIRNKKKPGLTRKKYDSDDEDEIDVKPKRNIVNNRWANKKDSSDDDEKNDSKNKNKNLNKRGANKKDSSDDDEKDDSKTKKNIVNKRVANKKNSSDDEDKIDAKTKRNIVNKRWANKNDSSDSKKSPRNSIDPDELKKVKDEHERDKDKYESQLDDLRKQLKQTKEELDKKTQAIATMKVKLIDKTAGAVSAAENQKSVAEARAKQMEVDKLNKDKEEINEKLKKSEEELALSRKEVGKLAKEMEDMKLLNVKKGNNPVNELPDWWNKYKV